MRHFRIRSNIVNYQRGFSLLEVLIAVVILSIGLLGVAGLQLAGLRFAHNANLRYIAALQANDIADRMRANRPGVIAGAYNNLNGTGSDPGCIDTGCSPTQMAATDAFEWNTANANLLPSGAGTVTGQGVDSVFTITINWTEMGPGAVGGEVQTFVMNVQP